jgi:hypothetical protein
MKALELELACDRGSMRRLIVPGIEVQSTMHGHSIWPNKDDGLACVLLIESRKKRYQLIVEGHRIAKKLAISIVWACNNLPTICHNIMVGKGRI